jgi:hypothetical protein
MTRGQIQDRVGTFASENPKYRAAALCAYSRPRLAASIRARFPS